MKLKDLKIGTVFEYLDYCYLYLGINKVRYDNTNNLEMLTYRLHKLEHIAENNQLVCKEIQLKYVKDKVNWFLTDKLYNSRFINIDCTVVKNQVFYLFNIDRDLVIKWYLKNKILDSNLPELVDVDSLVSNNNVLKLDTLENRIKAYSYCRLLYMIYGTISVFQPIYVKQFKPYHVYIYPVSNKAVLSLPNDRFIYCKSYMYVRKNGIFKSIYKLLNYKYKIISIEKKPNLVDINEDFNISNEKQCIDVEWYIKEIRKFCNENNIFPSIV